MKKNVKLKMFTLAKDFFWKKHDIAAFPASPKIDRLLDTSFHIHLVTACPFK